MKLAAVVREITGGFEALGVKGEVAVKGRHYVLKEVPESSGTGDALPVGLEKDAVCGIELQNGFELFRAKVLDSGFAQFGEGFESRGPGSGGCGAGKARCEEGGEGQERYDSLGR